MWKKTKKTGLTILVVSLLIGCGEEDEISGNNLWEVSTLTEPREALENAATNGANDTIVL